MKTFNYFTLIILITFSFSVALAATQSFETLAIYDLPSDTGTSIEHPTISGLVFSTFRSLPTGVAGQDGGSINLDKDIAFSALVRNVNTGNFNQTIVTRKSEDGSVLKLFGSAGPPYTPIINNDEEIIYWRPNPPSGHIILEKFDSTFIGVALEDIPIGTTGFTFGTLQSTGPGAEAEQPGGSTSHIVFKAVATDDDNDSEYAQIRYNIGTGEYDILTRHPEAPNPSTGRFVLNIENIDVNDNGVLAFMGRYNPPGGTCCVSNVPNDTTWSIARGSDISSADIVLQSGDSLAGTSHVIRAFLPYLIPKTMGPAINNNNEMVIGAPLEGFSTIGNVDSIIIDRNNGDSLEVLAIIGEEAPNGNIFSRFGNFHISDNGQVAFLAGLDGSISPDQALFATSLEGELFQLATIGDPIGVTLPNGMPQDKILSAISLSKPREKSFNPDGVLVVGAKFTDGSQAVLAIDLLTIGLPEDNIPAISAVGLIALLSVLAFLIKERFRYS